MEALTNREILEKRLRQRVPPERRIMRDDEMEMKKCESLLV